uniref:Uncharacterized protein n=1 Tax=Leersia perrieri TaxID=77586 RepID=A0A0D9VWA6_9ORYZ
MHVCMYRCKKIDGSGRENTCHPRRAYIINFVHSVIRGGSWRSDEQQYHLQAIDTSRHKLELNPVSYSLPSSAAMLNMWSSPTLQWARGKQFQALLYIQERAAHRQAS